MYHNKRTGIMLAKPYEERRLTDPKFKWSWPVGCQAKLDGERCRMIPSNGQIIPISSEMNVFNTIPHIREELESIHLKVELDGELYCHEMSFEQIHSIVSTSRKSLHPEYEKIKFHCFDLIETDVGIPQDQRYTILSDWYHSFNLQTVMLVEMYECDNLEDIMIHYNMFLEEKYEGIIIRELGAPYLRKRVGTMLKFKPKKEDCYAIIGWDEAIDKEGNPKGMLGALRCCGSDGTEFRIGAGCLTHKERIDIFENPLKIQGKFARVQYQNITAKRVPRFGLCIEIVETMIDGQTKGE